MPPILTLRGPGSSAPVRVTLDDLWAEAEGLGEVSVVSVEPCTFRAGYDVQIRFKSGQSTVYAKFVAKTAIDALSGAISEARRMGAV